MFLAVLLVFVLCVPFQGVLCCKGLLANFASEMKIKTISFFMLYIIYFQLLLEVIFTSAAGLVMTNVTVLKLENYCRMDD